MGISINFYGDESNHLLKPGDNSPMVLGAIWGASSSTRKIATRMRDIKGRHGVGRDFEVKWTKVSPGNLDLYLDIVDLYLDSSDLNLRAVLIPDKGLLRHEEFGQSHDDFYYKMWYQLFEPLLTRSNQYRIYLDHKDARDQMKANELHHYLCGRLRDHNKQALVRVQTVRSDHVEQIQLCDLLIGAIGYANRGLESSDAKLAIVRALQQGTGYDLTQTTLLGETKLNMLRWVAS